MVGSDGDGVTPVLRPSLDFLAFALFAGMAYTLLLSHAPESERLVNSPSPGALVGLGITLMIGVRLAALIWTGGGVRQGPCRRHTVRLEDDKPVWLGQVTVKRGMGLEMWATNEAPTFPAVELLYYVRRVGGGPSASPTQVCLPGRSRLPWLLQNRHARAWSRIFSDLVPDATYEYGVSAAGWLRAPQSLRVSVVETFSLRALVLALRRSDAGTLSGQR